MSIISKPIIMKYLYLLILIIFMLSLYLAKNIYPVYVDSINNIVYTTCLLIPVVLGTQILLLTGYFDLSIGATVCLNGILTSIFYLRFHSLAIAVSLSIFTCMMIGWVNGMIVTKLKIHSLITTIAMTSIVSGICLLVSDSSTLVGLPTNFYLVSHGTIFNISNPIYFGTLTFLILYFANERTLLFLRFYQVGSSSDAAVSCGIKKDRYIIIAYIFSAIGAGLAGLLELSRTMSATPTPENTLSLDLIAACVIGGTSLNGGKGSVLGAIIGLITMKTIEFVVILAGLDLYWRYLVIGGLVLIISAFNKNKFKPFHLKK